MMSEYITFSRKRTAYGIVYEHATLPVFQLAAYFERLLNPRHPENAQAKELAEHIMARSRDEKMALGRERMNRTRSSMTEEEWSMIVD